MAERYYIRPGQGLHVHGHGILPPGSVITRGMIPAENFKGLVDRGILAVDNLNAEAREEKAAARQLEREITDGRTAGLGAPRWNLDPKTLEDKSLDALNLLIAERMDGKPFKEAPDVAAAIKKLSADFKG